MANKDLITIDLSALKVIEQDGDKFLMTANAEDALEALIELKKEVAFVEDKIKESLGKAMQAINCVKIEGETIKVTRRFYGDRFEIYDRDLALASGFAVEEVKVKADTKQIDMYQKDTGELPEGIKLRERTESISIATVKDKEE